MDGFLTESMSLTESLVQLLIVIHCMNGTAPNISPAYYLDKAGSIFHFLIAHIHSLSDLASDVDEPFRKATAP